MARAGASSWRRSICSRARSARASAPPSSTRPPSASSARAARRPTFKGYRGFPGSICASPNAMVVHGIPGPYSLRAATSSRSTSASRSTAGSPTPPAPSPSGRSTRSRRTCCGHPRVAARRRRAVPAGQPHGRCLQRHPARRRGRRALGRALARRPRRRALHARGPAGAQLRRPGKGPLLEEGMVLAIEPMTTAGRAAVRVAGDGWAIFSQDGSPRRTSSSPSP